MTFNGFLIKFCVWVVTIFLGWVSCMMFVDGVWFGGCLFGIPALILFVFATGLVRMKTQAEIDAYVATKKGLNK